MNSMLMLLNQPLVERRSQGAWSLIVAPGMCLLLAVLLTALMLWGNVKPPLLYIPFGIGTTLLVLLWWALFVSSAANACTPINLQLVPHFKKRVLQATFLSWLVLSLLLVSFFYNPFICCAVVWTAAFGLALPTGHTKTATLWAAGLGIIFSAISTVFLWPGIGQGHAYWPLERLPNVFVIWTVVSSMLALAAVARLFPAAAGLLAWILIAFTLFSAKITGATSFNFRQTTDLLSNQFALCIAIAIFLLGLSLWGLVGGRGDQRLARYQRTIARRNLIKAASDPAAQTRWRAQNWLTRGHAPLFTRALASALGRRLPVHRLLGFCFGPSVHWTAFIWLAMTSGGLAVLLPLLLSAREPRDIGLVLMICFPVAFIAVTPQLARSMYKTRREQSLLSLTPYWPNERALNRWLAGFVCRYVFFGWLTGVSVMAFISFFYQLSPGTFAGLVFAMTTAALIMNAAGLRDYAHMEKPGQFAGMLTPLAALLSYGVGLLTIVFKGQFALAAMLAFLIAVPSIAIAVRRWRALVSGPKALPVGRLAAD